MEIERGRKIERKKERYRKIDRERGSGRKIERGEGVVYCVLFANVCVEKDGKKRQKILFCLRYSL